MKHFIIIIHYLEDIQRIKVIRPRHREFLDKAYKNGVALFSGPQTSQTGGIIAARGKTIEEIKKFFIEDPYQKERVAEYQYIEFEPVHYQSFLKEWVKK